MNYEEALKLFKDHKYMTDFSWQDEMSEAAIEALEKQIPKKPKGRYDYHGKEIIGALCKCPNCGSMVIQNLLTSETDYCIKCGQALDWE